MAITCEHCCGADQFFDLKGAKKEAKKYLKSGPRTSTKRLIGALKLEEGHHKSLLDIGGGIGAIQLAFIKATNGKVTGIDASSGYLEIAKELSKKRHASDSIVYEHGDFVDHHEHIQKHDLVTLDKVVCCYPDYVKLLNSSLDKCNDKIALSFPLGGTIGKFVNWLGTMYVKYFTDNPFRPYIHSSKDMNDLIIGKGFQPVSKSISFPWNIWVFEKVKG